MVPNIPLKTGWYLQFTDAPHLLVRDAAGDLVHFPVHNPQDADEIFAALQAAQAYAHANFRHGEVATLFIDDNFAWGE